MKYLKYIILSLFIIVGTSFFTYKVFIDKDTKKDPIVKENQEIKENVVEEQIIDDSIEEETTIIEEQTKEEIKEETKENETTPQVKEETPKTNDIPKTNEVPEVVEEEVQETPIWEELGISEYDYYNSPMWSWARVDFKVSDYGTQQKTEEACQNYGNNFIEGQSLGFSCTNVNSYSGKYLGEMFKTF